MPNCKTAAGCIIPRLPAAGARAKEIHKILDQLKNLNIAAYICSVYGVDKNDLELLALVEQQSRPLLQPLDQEDP